MASKEDPFTYLGMRLKTERVNAKKTLREMAGVFNVSSTFLSQLENGKAKPSVATLYSLARALDVDMDCLLSTRQSAEITLEPNFKARISTTDANNRTILPLGSGVTWEQLASVTESGGHFVEILYHPGSESSANGKLITHDGYEYGYGLEGDLEMTIGDFVFTLGKSHSFGFDSSIPHIFRNRADVDFRGVWFVHDCKGRNL